MIRALMAIAALPCVFAAAGAEPAALPPFRVPDCLGVNIHFAEPRQDELDSIRRAGFGMIRMDLVWERVERTRGEYDFSSYRRLSEALWKRGMTPLYILDYGNPLYEENRSVTTEEGRRAFARFAAEAVRRLDGGPVIWEIWNEPNIRLFWSDQPSAGDYVKLAKAASAAMREVDANCLVVAPATSEIDMEFLEACFELGLLEHIGAVTVHPYRRTPPETALGEYEALERLIREYAPNRELPILSGEWGYSMHDYGTLKVDEHMQAQFIVRQFLTNFMAGVRASIWYDWHDDGPDPAEREHNFGIVTHEKYEEKEAFRAARTFNTVLGGKSFIRRLHAGDDDVHLAMFGDREGRIIAAWTTGGPKTLSVGEIALSRRAYGLFGEPVQLETENGAVKVPLSGDVIYLRVE